MHRKILHVLADARGNFAIASTRQLVPEPVGPLPGLIGGSGLAINALVALLE